MPIANSFKLKDVLEACHYYFEKTGRRLTFEYSLVKGVNDNLEEAKALTELIKDQHGHVNLIRSILLKNGIMSSQTKRP